MYDGNMKTCRRCKGDKPLEAFVVDSRTKDGRAGRCKACVSDVKRQKRASDPEAARADDARQYRSNRSSRLAASARWQQANQDKVQAAVRRRRARRLEAFVEDVQMDVLVDLYGRWCYLCESGIGQGELMEPDHVEPIAHGGQHSYANVRPTHQHCNRVKNDRPLHELDLPFVPPHLKAVA